MCGIAGYLGYFAPELLFGMAAKIAHRGPDGEGFWSDAAARVGLAHRRLAIIDPSAAAAQPMAGCEGRYQIVFNGEIYNFRELGETLRRYGYAFNPNSDTAVLAPLYDLYGVEMLDRLNGIFAFALWDRETSELLLARDAFGVKPLYYSTAPRGLTFASELKALLHAPGLDPQLSMKALSDYLSYQWSPGERTLFGSIRKLPPGHILKASGKGQSVERWFSPADRVERPQGPISARQLVSELRRLIDDVVRDQCVSDAPIGAFLSGGVDSSAVVAAMIAGGHAPAKTYCIGFEGDGQARLARRPLGDTHSEHTHHAQLGEHPFRHRQLTAATVHEQHVGQRALALLQTLVAPHQRLLHGGVIVSRRDAIDIEAPILRLERPLAVEYHTGGHGRLAAGMADID